MAHLVKGMTTHALEVFTQTELPTLGSAPAFMAILAAIIPKATRGRPACAPTRAGFARRAPPAPPRARVTVRTAHEELRTLLNKIAPATVQKLRAKVLDAAARVRKDKGADASALLFEAFSSNPYMAALYAELFVLVCGQEEGRGGWVAAYVDASLEAWMSCELIPGADDYGALCEHNKTVDKCRGAVTFLGALPNTLIGCDAIMRLQQCLIESIARGDHKDIMAEIAERVYIGACQRATRTVRDTKAWRPVLESIGAVINGKVEIGGSKPKIPNKVVWRQMDIREKLEELRRDKKTSFR